MDSKMNNNFSFDLPKNKSNVIKVIGVGGGGSNAINHMFKKGINGVDFVILNTDAQALNDSPVPIKIQLGATLTEGLGAGANPEVGAMAAKESFEEIKEVVDGFLEDNGITPPSLIGRSIPSTGPLSNKGVISQLTEDKLSTILAEVTSLKNAKASFDEVKEVVDNFLKENNVKPPNMGGTFVDVLT